MTCYRVTQTCLPARKGRVATCTPSVSDCRLWEHILFTCSGIFASPFQVGDGDDGGIPCAGFTLLYCIAVSCPVVFWRPTGVLELLP